MVTAYLKTRNADVFGQLVTQNAVENLVRKFGNNEEKRHSVWNSGKSQADALRIMAETPFVSLNTIPSRELPEIMSTSLIQELFQHG